MGENKAWHGEDVFWELVESFVFTERRAELAWEQVTQIVEMLGLAEGARVLDLPCGNGRHSLALAERGFEVTGVDRTERYIETARSEAAKRGLQAKFLTGDMRDFREPGQYDAVLNLFGSFGYFEDPADDLKVLKNTFASLRPGGQVLIETAGKEIVARDFQARDWAEVGDALLLMDRAVGGHWERIESRYIVIRGGERFEHQVSIRSYSAAELSSLFLSAGFKDVRIYGSLEGIAYNQNAQRLVATGRK
jgi:SAM-dependent methyltransferase